MTENNEKQAELLTVDDILRLLAQHIGAASASLKNDCVAMLRDAETTILAKAAPSAPARRPLEAFATVAEWARQASAPSASAQQAEPEYRIEERPNSVIIWQGERLFAQLSKGGSNEFKAARANAEKIVAALNGAAPAPAALTVAVRALERLAAVPGCGCAFPCRCGGAEWTRMELEGRMDIAAEALAEIERALLAASPADRGEDARYRKYAARLVEFIQSVDWDGELPRDVGTMVQFWPNPDAIDAAMSASKDGA